MRLPTRKVYRAFPELDRFDDRVCQSYVWRAVEKKWVSLTLAAIGLFILLTMWCGGAMAIPALLSGRGKVLGPNSDVSDWFVVLYFTLAVTIPIGSVMFVRDIWLRKAIRSQLVGTACPTCEYQLIGLIVNEGRVNCPECGASVRLADLGLSPEDLIAKSSDTVPPLATASPTPPVQP